MRANLKLVKPAPIPVNGTVPPRRTRNADVRPREYLTPKEVERLIKASRARGRYGARDALAILITYRHGLRAVELADLRWDQVDFDHGLLHVRRKKNGMPSTHPIPGDELRALRALRREHDAARYVFMTGRGSPMSAAGFRKMLARTGQEAKFPLLVHPHMLRLLPVWLTRGSMAARRPRAEVRVDCGAGGWSVRGPSFRWPHTMVVRAGALDRRRPCGRRAPI